MSDQLLAAVAQYGAPALFAIVAVASIGVPLPITLLLIVAGSMVEQGAMRALPAMALAAAGSVLGDQIGYSIGRWGGPALAGKVAGWFGKRLSIAAVETKVKQWGGPGIFVTRWLLSPIGPWINLAAGTTRYPWHRFLFWDALGETVGAILFISLGRYFNDRVMSLYAVLGDLTWAVFAFVAAVILGYRLFRYLRR